MHLSGELPAAADERLQALLDVDLAVLDIAGRLVEHWNAHAALHGVTGAQIKVLLTLGADEVVTMSEVATRLDYDASNLTTLVERLSSRHLLQRVEDPGDRRRKSLRLTAAGLKLRDAFWASLTTGDAPLADMSHRNLRQLATLLHRAQRAMSATDHAGVDQPVLG